MRHLERLLFIPGGASAQPRSGFNRTMLSRPRSSSSTTRTMTSGGREGWTSGEGLSFRVHRQCQVENGWKRQPFSNSAGASTRDLLSPGRLGVGRPSVVFLSTAIKVLREYERAVIFRLGRLIAAKGPRPRPAHTVPGQDGQGEPAHAGHGGSCPG
jgi:hypothetical protein